MKIFNLGRIAARMFTVIIVSIAFLLNNSCYGADTAHVNITYDKVVTDPSKGINTYSKWAVFPKANDPVRKITLYVTLGCPDSMRCADWDYSDRILLKRKGNKDATELNYTLAHLLTPYGGAFNNIWSFTWKVDVTDFSLWLRDSIEIAFEHSGYEENRDRGWKVMLDFSFVKGNPVAEPVAIHPVYNGNYQYGNSSMSIDSLLSPYSFSPEHNSSLARLYILQTGHGMDSAGCGEFCSKYRETWWNGAMVSRKDIWKKCGDNPLFPQAGTWVFDRANWCPGYLNQPEILNQKIAKGRENVFNVKMQNYTTADKNVNENVFAYIVEYRNPESKNDIAIEDIVVPSLVQLYGRKNPASFNPVITIRNNGRSPLQSCIIRYGTIGFDFSEFKWSGNLNFNETTDIVLPGDIVFAEGANKFLAEIKNPNGKTDQNLSDNQLVSEFLGVPRHGNKIVIQLKTNNAPGDNSYAVRNSSGKIIYERAGGSLQKDTLYNDTLQLMDGSYSFILNDTAGNGLDFWYAVKAGRGTCKLLDGRGRMIKNFESDFGNYINYDFRVTSDSSQWAKPTSLPAIGAFPTMSTGKVQLDYFSNDTKNALVQVVTDAPEKEVVEEHTYSNVKQGLFSYDLSRRPPQRYYIKVFIDKELVFTKRLRIVAKRNE